MNVMDRKFNGFSDSVWPPATLTLANDRLTLRKSDSITTHSYTDINYITVTWLGIIRFYLKEDKHSKHYFSFLSLLAPELLVILADKRIVAGGHVARRLLVSRIIIGALYSVLYLLVIAGFAAILPSTPDDSSNFFTYKDLVFVILFTLVFPVMSVWKYLTGNYSAQADAYKNEDWFPL
jgi:hypothetical protein